MATEGLTITLSAQAMAMAGLNKEAIIEALVLKGVSLEEATLAAETALATAATNSQTASVSKLKLVFEGLKSAIVAHPYLAAAAAITAVAVAIARVKKAADEAAQARRDKAVETGKAAQEEQQQIAELYEKYKEANKAYQDGTGKKEDLEIATRNLIDVLGDESGTIRNLKGDYEALNEEISKAVKQKQIENLAKTIAAVDAQRGTVNAKFGKDSSKTKGADYTFIANDDYVESMLFEIIRKTVDDIETEGMFNFNTGEWADTFFRFKQGDSPEKRYRDLLTAKDAILKMAQDEFISSGDLTGSTIYAWLLEQIEELKPEIEELNNLISDSNKAALDLHYKDYVKAFFGNQNGTPESIEEFDKFREFILAQVKSSNDFMGSFDDMQKSVDDFLGSMSAFDSFRGFNRFKEEFKSLDKDVKAAVEDMLKSGKEMTGDQVDAFKRWADGAKYSTEEVIGYLKQLNTAQSEETHNLPTLSNIDELATLRDELAKTSKAWEEYNKILEGGDKGDAANQMASAWKKASEDLEKGRIDTKAVWGAAKLLFSDQQLADMKYDLVEIAKQLRSPMMQALFAPPEEGEDELDLGVRFADYIKQHAGNLGGAAQIIDAGGGKFQFMYESIGKLAGKLGMSEEALSALLDALDAFGVQSMTSNQDASKLAQEYEEIRKHAASASDAVRELIRSFASRENPLNEHEIIESLKMLRDNGVIEGDDSEFSAMIADVLGKMEETDNKVATPTVTADTSPADIALNNFEARLNALDGRRVDTYVVNHEASDKEEQKLNSSSFTGSGRTPRRYAAGTKDAPGGTALVNEKGPELISDNGVAYIANGGRPGFVNLGKGAVVFTAGETKGIFSKGYSNIPVRAYADGTENRASLRDRLINGGKVKGLYTGGVSKTFTCIKCGYSWQYSPIDYPSGPTATCPKCGAVYAHGQYLYGGTPVSQEHLNDDYYPYHTYTEYEDGNYYGGYTIDNYDAIYQNYVDHGYYGPQDSNYNSGYVHEKRCPNCGNAISFNLTKCPHCGYNYATGKVASKQVESKQDVNTGKALASKAQTGGSSGYTGGGGGSSVGSADYASQEEPEKVDWIAVLLNRIQRKIADLEKVASSGFKDLGTRLNAAGDEVAQINKEISVEREAYARYIQEAGSVGLSSDLAELVRDGTIDINEYDDDTRELIDAYSEWYEKALDSKSAIEELTQEVADLFVDMFNNTQTDFENQAAMIEHRTNLVQSNMSEASARGYLDSAKYYEQLIDFQKDSVAVMESELTNLRQKFQEAMDSGTIDAYSEAWYDMAASIQSVEESIADANVQLLEYAKTMRSIRWGYFDYAMSEFGQLQDEANFLIGIMANDNLFDEMGKFSDKGTATMGLRTANYNAYMKQADEYAKEMRSIDRELAKSPYDTELIERRRTLLGLQRQMIQAAESEKDAIKDLVSQGIQLELNALKDLIDEYVKSLDGAKSLYDYQKKLSEKTGDIAKISKQLTAYQGDDSEENRARIQKLQEDLKKAREDLEETEYEQSIADQKKLLDSLYTEFEEYMNARLDNLEELVEKVVDGVNGNADVIRDEIINAAGQVGYTVTDGLNGVLRDGVYAYYDSIFTGVTSINGYLDSINQKISEMITEADRLAKELAAGIQMTGFGGGSGSGQAGAGGSGRPANAVEGYFGSDGTFWYPPDKNGDQLGTDFGQIGTTYYDTKTDKSYYWNGQQFVKGTAPAGSAQGIGMAVGSGGYALKVSEKEALNKLADAGYGWVKDIGLVGASGGSLEVLDKVMDEIQRKKPEVFNELFGYSTGGLADYTGLAMLHGTQEKPELVLNADDTEKFLAAAKLMRTPVLEVLADRSFRLPGVGEGPASGVTIENFTVDFNLENVSSYEEIIAEARNDPRFERLVDSIIFSKMRGKSVFGEKNRIHL